MTDIALTDGILPPEEWETEAPFDWTVLIEWSFSMLIDDLRPVLRS